VHLNYTKINIYSAQPIYQGSSSEIFGKNANNTMKELGRKIYDFYKKFQSSKSDIKLAEGVRVMVFNATFNNISVISWWSVLLVKETGIP
jgi:hypothetical protein